MENSVEFLHLSDIFDVPHGCSTIISSYISLIKINGQPIIPPLITDEKRTELNEYKRKAIEIESRIAQSRSKNRSPCTPRYSTNQRPNFGDLPQSRQSTPTRPVSLSLIPYAPGRSLPAAEVHSTKDLITPKYDIPTNMGNTSSHKSTKPVNKSFRSTLEQRLANEDDVVIRNRKNDFKQSPIIEENYSAIVEDIIDSDNDSKKERKRWSPLKMDSLNSLKVELPIKHSEQLNDNEENDENFEISFDEMQRSSETITPSPNLMRQNSYTLLTPSPALLNYLESQKEKENTQRSHSGRKTWDLTRAKQNWEPKLNDPIDPGKVSDGSEKNLSFRHETSSLDSYVLMQKTQNRMSTPKDNTLSNDSCKPFLSKHDSSSLESISMTQKVPSYSTQESLFHNDGSTSPSSCNSKKISPKYQKIKCKIKSKKSKSSFKNVPSPNVTEKVPCKNGSNLTQSVHIASVPLEVGEELTDLSDLLLKVKVEHERQKKELEEKQRLELQQLEQLLKAKETEFLKKVGTPSRKSQRSIFSQFQNVNAQGQSDSDSKMIGDGSHIPMNVYNSELGCHPQQRFHFGDEYIRRPQSAKDFHSQFHNYEKQTNRRTRSMDFNQGNNTQDTDLDVSFQSDSIRTKDILRVNDDVESDTVSNISSRSSTMSSETRMIMPLLETKRYEMSMSSEEYKKYNKAATIITAAARGFLTRRLLNTSHVQGLITTLRDAISCATQLHSASDLGDSDVDLMKRLGRQIEAAWEAVYGVFFNTGTLEKLQLISADRERLRNLTARSTETQKRISSATEKSLRRKKSGSLMSKSQTTNGCKPRRHCLKMAASYPSPMSRQKL